MQLVRVNSRSLMNFSVCILQTLVKLVQVEILENLQAGEANGVDCSVLYHDVNRILNTFINKPIHTNITKSEHLALENLRKDKDCITVTAEKGVALIVMDKTECITKCEALLQDDSVYQHLSRDTFPTIHKELVKILARLQE